MKKLAFCILMLGFGVAGAEEKGWHSRLVAEYQAKVEAERQARVLEDMKRLQQEQLDVMKKAAEQAKKDAAAERARLEQLSYDTLDSRKRNRD
jgi:glutamate synthase domain-containing protein 3